MADDPWRLREVLDVVRDPLCLVDDELRFVWLNAAAADYMRHPTAEVVGRRMGDLFPQLAGSVLEQRLALTRERRSVERFEIESRLQPGRWYEVQLQPWDGGTLVYYRDQTARKWDADQLRLVTDTMAAEVARCSRERRYLWVSRAYANARGFEPDGMVGRTVREVLGARVAEQIEPYIERVLAGEPVRYEQRIDYQDRGSIWVEAHYVPTFGRDGQPDGWVALVVDVDERRRIEEQLREADRRKDDFIALLAHELRNPLAPIRNSVHLLRHGPPDPARTARLHETIERQVSHMARLLDDLLDVSRIARGKVLLRREGLDLGAVVRGAAEDLRTLFERRDVRLDVDVPPTPVSISGDRTRIAQITGNLLHNASRFTDAGGGVRVGVRAAGGEAILTVTDDGIGIEPDLLPRIFEPFSQGERTTEREGGLGLGLALVRGLAELHGGTVEAASAGSGRGARFTVRLPLSLVTAREPDRPPSAPVRRRLSVLVVEDNPDVAESLHHLLEWFGHDVAVASTGPDALSCVTARRPDVVLCDIGLPGGWDGYTVAVRLREMVGDASLRLVALSGYGQDGDKARSAAAGFDRHLTKPIDPEQLRAVLDGTG